MQVRTWAVLMDESRVLQGDGANGVCVSHAWTPGVGGGGELMSLLKSQSLLETELLVLQDPSVFSSLKAFN